MSIWVGNNKLLGILLWRHGRGIIPAFRTAFSSVSHLIANIPTHCSKIHSEKQKATFFLFTMSLSGALAVFLVFACCKLFYTHQETIFARLQNLLCCWYFAYESIHGSVLILYCYCPISVHNTKQTIYHASRAIYRHEQSQKFRFDFTQLSGSDIIVPAIHGRIKTF